jgi:hypothetical protein
MRLHLHHLSMIEGTGLRDASHRESEIASTKENYQRRGSWRADQETRRPTGRDPRSETENDLVRGTTRATVVRGIITAA